MITFPHKKSSNDWIVQMDIHDGVFVGPMIPPFPFKGLHVGGGSLGRSMPGSAKANAYTVKADGQFVVSRGHEVKGTISPHMNIMPPPPLINLKVPFLESGSSSKCQFAVSSVEGPDGPIAASVFPGVGFNMACNDPVSLPTSLVSTSGTVTVGLTAGDIAASIALAAGEAVVEFGVGKLLGKAVDVAAAQVLPKPDASAVAKDLAAELSLEDVQRAAVNELQKEISGIPASTLKGKIMNALGPSIEGMATQIGKTVDAVESSVPETLNKLDAYLRDRAEPL